MKHRKTMNNLQSMAPKLLIPKKEGEDFSVGSDGKRIIPLSVTIKQLQQKISALEQETALQSEADSCKEAYLTLLQQATTNGQWPIEALAVRKGIHLKYPSSQNQSSQQQQQQQQGQSDAAKKAQADAQAQLQAILDRQMAHVDRLERMPSPYLWHTLQDMENRLHNLKNQVFSVHQQINHSVRSDEPEDIASIVHSQNRALAAITARMEYVHSQVEALRDQYTFYEKGENVIAKATYEEQQRQRRIDDQIRMQYVQSASKGGASGNTQQSTQAPGQASAPASAVGGFGGFGSPAPAPSAAFSFSSASTPAPAPGGLFGSTPAPAPGGLFGSTPAPAPGGLFGSTPAPAPSNTSFSFNTSSATAPAPATTPKKGSKSRNKNRLSR